VLGRSASRNLAGRVTTYVIGTAVPAVGLGALGILDADGDAGGANITSFEDALCYFRNFEKSLGRSSFAAASS
jgi:voltage-gated potassium channel